MKKNKNLRLMFNGTQYYCVAFSEKTKLWAYQKSNSKPNSAFYSYETYNKQHYQWT